MSTSLPSVPDFLRMINTHSAPTSLAPRAISSDDEPNTPPNTPPRSDPEYTTPWTKGLSGPGAGPPIMPFFLDEVRTGDLGRSREIWGRYAGGMPAEEGLLAVLVGVEVVHQGLELHQSAVPPPGARDLQPQPRAQRLGGAGVRFRVRGGGRG